MYEKQLSGWPQLDYIMQQAHTWNTAFHKAEQEYGRNIKVPKSSVSRVPSRFTKSPMSLHLGANQVYRDQRATDSLQIREYDNYYTVQMDRHNPEEGNAIKHAVTDAFTYTAAALGVGAVILGGGSS